jgi:translation initiation factor IF-1
LLHHLGVHGTFVVTRLANQHLLFAKITNYMNKRNIILTVLAIFVLGLGIGYYLYTKSSAIKSTGAPDFEKDINQWVKELDADTGAANTFSAFVGKSVKLTAEVGDVVGDSSVTLQLKSGVEGFFVNANFHTSMNSVVSGVVAGDVVTVQCVCDGLVVPMSADDLFAEKKIDLSRCDLLKHEKHQSDVSRSVDHETSDSIK